MDTVSIATSIAILISIVLIIAFQYYLNLFKKKIKKYYYLKHLQKNTKVIYLIMNYITIS